MNRLNQLNASQNAATQSQESEIDCLIMLDRSCDLISPFCQQQTYEGQVDEHFGIRTAQTEIACDILSTQWKPEPGQPTTEIRRFDQSDIIFKQIRSRAYESLGYFFKSKNQEFEDATDKSKNQASDLKELEANVRRIKEMNIPVAKPLLDIHNNLCYYFKQRNIELTAKQCYQLEHLINQAEQPKEIIEALQTKIVRNTRIETVLRLLCLFSVTQGGLKQETFENLKRTFIIEYGYPEIATMCNLEVAGLFTPKQKGFEWSDIKEVSLAAN